MFSLSWKEKFKTFPPLPTLVHSFDSCVCACRRVVLVCVCRFWWKRVVHSFWPGSCSPSLFGRLDGGRSRILSPVTTRLRCERAEASSRRVVEEAAPTPSLGGGGNFIALDHQRHTQCGQPRRPCVHPTTAAWFAKAKKQTNNSSTQPTTL